MLLFCRLFFNATIISEHAAALHIKYYWETDTISLHDTTSGKGHHCQRCRGSSTLTDPSECSSPLEVGKHIRKKTIEQSSKLWLLSPAHPILLRSSGLTDAGLYIALLPTQRLNKSTINKQRLVKCPLLVFSKYTSETSTLTHLTSPDKNRPEPAVQVGKRGSLSTLIPSLWMDSQRGFSQAPVRSQGPAVPLVNIRYDPIGSLHHLNRVPSK